MKKYAIPLLVTGLVAALLAACSGGDDAMSPPQVPLPAPTPVADTPPADKFTAQVAALVASQPDDTESAALDDTAPTMPDDTEPQAVMQ
jgi:hypothetical protein